MEIIARFSLMKLFDHFQPQFEGFTKYALAMEPVPVQRSNSRWAVVFSLAPPLGLSLARLQVLSLTASRPLPVTLGKRGPQRSLSASS